MNTKHWLNFCDIKLDMTRTLLKTIESLRCQLALFCLGLILVSLSITSTALAQKSNSSLKPPGRFASTLQSLSASKSVSHSGPSLERLSRNNPQNGADPAAPANLNYRKAQSPGGGQNSLGTGDPGGGGNGIKNRVWEGYQVNITELEAYKKFIVPRQNLLILSEEQKMHETEQTQIDNQMGKTWYIAPVKLIPISSEILGLTFIKNGSQQLAIQTMDEVWIAKEYWDKMSLKKKADLLSHEMTMSLYLYKFHDMKTLCRKYFYMSESVCDNFAKLEGADRYEKPRRLNAQDYQNIRGATAWFISKKVPYTNKEMNIILSKYDFDVRFFNTKGSADEKFDETLDRKLTRGDVWELVVRNIHKGQFQSQCVSTLDQQSPLFPCQIHLQQGDFLNAFDASLTPQLDTSYQWKLDGLFNMEGKLGFKKQEPADYIVKTIDQENGSIEWYASPEVGWTENKIKRVPGEKYFDIYVAVRKTTKFKQLVIEPIAILLAEKVYHGTTEVLIPENIKFTCHNASFTLNSEGQKNYLYLGSKTFKARAQVESFANYGMIDVDCSAFLNLFRANSNK